MFLNILFLYGIYHIGPPSASGNAANESLRLDIHMSSLRDFAEGEAFWVGFSPNIATLPH